MTMSDVSVPRDMVKVSGDSLSSRSCSDTVMSMSDMGTCFRLHRPHRIGHVGVELAERGDVERGVGQDAIGAGMRRALDVARRDQVGVVADEGRHIDDVEAAGVEVRPDIGARLPWR